MLTLQNITITRGANSLIENINLTVFEKNVIGIVGANGSGKTSLFAVIQNKLEPSAGRMQLKKNLVITALEQEVPALDISAMTYTISGDAYLFRILTQLEQAEACDDYDTVVSCHAKLHEIDGYSAQARAAKILVGLGFTQAEIHSPVKHFSGGWRMRLSLAKCLFSPSDLLLLDEPTNHLDMEAIVWLEQFIRYYSGAILLVSHDRDFLDHSVTHIAHIENQQLKIYSGNYSAFEVLRAQQIAIQKAQYKKQQAQISHKMKFVERFRYKASKASQAQSRLKAIEKMQLIAPVYEASPFTFHFMQPERMPNPMLAMRKVNLGYGDKTILKNINFTIMAGQRIGLLGVNGAGKSTLIKSICDELQPLQGTIERPAHLVIGYFAQHQVDHLPLEGSALSLLKSFYDMKTEKELVAYLGSFGFSREQSMSPLKQYSGGEKARVALALIILRKPNLLLLDEPTNHLDLEMRQALSFALQEYEGAMILVSHDRHLLRTLVDELYIIENGRLDSFDGTVEDYQILCS